MALTLKCDRCGLVLTSVNPPMFGDFLADLLDTVLILCPECKERVVGGLSESQA